MSQPEGEKIIVEQFARCYRRQIIGICVSVFFVLFLAAVYKRPDIFGEYLKSSLFAAECLVVAAFIGFTAANWRCPSCVRYLGHDLLIARCRRCGAKLR